MAEIEAEAKEEERVTELSDLPDAILTHIISLVSDVRSRNSTSLTCAKWRLLERSTRKSLSLRGNVRDLFQLPNCFPSVQELDLSLLSPWGHPFLSDPTTNQEIVALRLRQSFPDVTSLTVYARNPSTLAALSPQWPSLAHASLVRWHQRPDLPYGAELAPLLSSSPNLTSLDLSRYYCWTEDVHHAIAGHPSAAASLTRLNLLSSASAEGFRSVEIIAIASACPNLTHFLATCVFNPICFGFVGDEALLDIASGCPRLVQLHLADPDAFFDRPKFLEDEDSGITSSALEKLFASLPRLEEFALDICHNVRDAGPALKVLGNKCPRMRSLVLGQFQGICKAAGLHLDGVAVCGALQSLSVKNSADLTDAGLAAIARGCRRLSKLDIQGCNAITQQGIKNMAGMLRSTLVEVRIAGCPNLDPGASIRALEPIRDRIERLHIDCIWTNTQEAKLSPDANVDNFFYLDSEIENHIDKKCRYSDESHNHRSIVCDDVDDDGFWCRTWDRLRYLSLWFPAGEVLSPLLQEAGGLEDCPELEEICIKVEGDCRLRPTMQVFGLSCLDLYPKLSKMKLDCGEAIGFALTAPSGHMDLSFWERFYLHGIESLNLYELDYWPPHDRDVNQRSLSLPAAGLIQACVTLRKLFIHGTAHEHFMRFFLNMPVLRDVQLREDYYPAPENDMSTEMRVDSCSRFEDTLNNRIIPD